MRNTHVVFSLCWWLELNAVESCDVRRHTWPGTNVLSAPTSLLLCRHIQLLWFLTESAAWEALQLLSAPPSACSLPVSWAQICRLFLSSWSVADPQVTWSLSLTSPVSLCRSVSDTCSFLQRFISLQEQMAFHVTSRKQSHFIKQDLVWSSRAQSLF